MKLDQIILIIIILIALAYVLAAIAGAVAAGPWGIFIIIPILVVGGIFWAVIKQRLNNKEDDYYEKNVDK